MNNCNDFPTPIIVESPLETEENGPEVKRYCLNSYASIIGMNVYMASNTRPDISFAVHQCERFTRNTKASHELTLKRIFFYLQGIKDCSLVFNQIKKSVVCCCVDDDL